MKGKKLATIGLSFVLAVGCCAVVGGQKVEPQAVVAASTENTYVYSIENYTKGTLYELDFVNDYFGYSAPYSEYNTSSTGSTYALKKAQYYRWNIAYTYDACYNEETQKAEVTVSTLYFNGQDQYMAVAPDDATGAYKVESITKVEKGIASFTFEIPEDGYVVLTTTGSNGLADKFAVGNSVSGIIDQHRYELKNLSSDYEYSLRLTTKNDSGYPDSGFNGSDAGLLMPTVAKTVTGYATRSYIKAEKISQGRYQVTSVYRAGSGSSSLSYTINPGEILIGLGYVYKGNQNYMKGGFVTAVKVGDILSYTDRAEEKMVEGASLTLSGAIGLNFKLGIGVNSAGVQVVFKSGETELDRIQVSELTAVKSLSYAQFGVFKNWYKVSCPIFAKDYDKDITIEVQNSDGQVGLTETYSIEDYAQTIASGNYSQRLKDATQALVDYCKAACDYASGATVTAEKTDLDLSAYAPTQSGTATVSNVNVKLLLDSDTELRVYFTAEELLACTVAGVEQTPVSLGNNRYYVSYTDIGAHELMKAIDFTFGNYTISCSAMSYAYVILSNDAFIESQAGLYNAMEAMYNYYAKVDAYVKSLEG